MKARSRKAKTYAEKVYEKFYRVREYPGVTPLLIKEMDKIVKVRIGPERLKKAKEFLNKLTKTAQ